MAVEKVIKIVLDTSSAEADIDKLKGQLEEIQGTSVTIDLSTGDAIAELDEITQKLNQIDNKEVKLRMDNSDAKSEVDEIEQTIQRLDEETIKIDLDTAGAKAGIRELSTVGSDIGSGGGRGGFLGSLVDIFQTGVLAKGSTNLSSLNKAFADNSKELKKAEEDIDAYRASVDKLDKDIGKATAELEALAEAHRLAGNELKLELLIKEDDINATEEQIESYQTCIDYLQVYGEVVEDLSDKQKERIRTLTDEREEQVKKIKTGKDNIDALKDERKELDKNSESLKKSGKESKKAAKESGKFGVAIGKLGNFLKKSILYVFIAALAALAKALTVNQGAVDLFAKAWGAVSIAMEDLINYVTDNFMPAMRSIKDFFDNLTFESVGKAIKENIIERFESIIEVAGHLGKVFKQLFEGDFAGAWESAKDAGVEMVDVFTGVDDTVAKVTETVKSGIDAVTDYAKEVYDLSEQQVIATKNAAIAVASQGKIIAQYTRQAELLRQIRDDESASIYDRIQANQELGEVLTKLQEESVNLAKIQLRAAEITFQLNKNDANRIALIDAQTALIQANADAEGQASEQKVNSIALLREEAELRAELQDVISAGQIQYLEDVENAINFDVAKLQARKQVIAAEYEAEQLRYARLLENKSLSDEQLQIAEQEHVNNMNAIQRDSAQTSVDIADAVFEHENYMQKRRVSLLTEFGAFLQLLGEENKALAVAGIIVSTVASIASIIIDTQKANAGAIAKYAAVPGGAALSATEIAYNNISAGIGIATATVAGAKAISQLGGGGAVSGGSAPSGASAPPEYNVIAENEYNPIEDIANNTGTSASASNSNQVIKTYVLSKDVTSAQEYDRAVDSNASI